MALPQRPDPLAAADEATAAAQPAVPGSAPPCSGIPTAQPALIAWLTTLVRALRYPALGVTVAGISLLTLQLLVGRQLARQQLGSLADGAAANLLLAQVALERFSPEALQKLSGMRLAVGSPPGVTPRTAKGPIADAELLEQSRLLRQALCRRLSPCPVQQPGRFPDRGVWLELESALETVWLFVPLPPTAPWPPNPWMLSLSLGIGGLAAGLLFQALEVQRPLRKLEQALAQVGHGETTAPLPRHGAASVQRLTLRFNAMVDDLARNDLERTTMLAGIAHDLRSPLTRLRLRLQLASPATAAQEPAAAQRPTPTDAAAATTTGHHDLTAASADLDALERITQQFLVFAGSDRQEPPVLVPLEALLAETAAVVGSVPLTLELTPLQRRVQPTAMVRAVRNLLENACAHGQPPLRLVLLPVSGEGLSPAEADRQGRDGFEIQVWDRGEGIQPEDWARALMPFQRLDGARSRQGHSGLGLAIAERIARDHGGGLRRLREAGQFGVALRGHSLPEPVGPAGDGDGRDTADGRPHPA